MLYCHCLVQRKGAVMNVGSKDPDRENLLRSKAFVSSMDPDYLDKIREGIEAEQRDMILTNQDHERCFDYPLSRR